MARRAPNGWQLQRMNRATIAANAGKCAYCGQPATEVDHAIALHAGGDNSEANRVPICRDCHAAKTRSDVRSPRRKR